MLPLLLLTPRTLSGNDSSGVPVTGLRWRHGSPDFVEVLRLGEILLPPCAGTRLEFVAQGYVLEKVVLCTTLALAALVPTSNDDAHTVLIRTAVLLFWLACRWLVAQRSVNVGDTLCLSCCLPNLRYRRRDLIGIEQLYR